MNVKEEYTVSAIALAGPYTQVFDQEAKDWLQAHGYTFVYVDDEGIFHALSPSREVLDGFRLYKRKLPAVM